MSKPHKIAIVMSRREQILGFVYLLLELFVLPSVLSELNALLPVPLSSSWLNFLYFSFNFLAVCLLFHSFLRRCLAQAGRDVEGFLMVTFCGFGIYYLANLTLTFAIRLLAPDFSNLNDGNIAQQIGSNYFVMAFGTAVLVPVAEELLHRGLVFGSLYSKSHWAAYLVSSLLFAAIHILGYVNVYTLPHLLIAFAQYLPAGFALAWAYRRSGSIFSPILIHAAVNTLALLSLR